MKKSEVLKEIEELLSGEIETTTLDKVIKTINQLGRKNTSSKSPVYVTIDGKDYKWCNRHKQYEPVDWFLVENSGKVKPECAAAYYRWQDYGKLLNKAIKDGDDSEIGRLTRLRKSGGYDLETDSEDFKDKIMENLEIEIDPELAVSKDDALKD